jgi:T4 RnlA family RNA ligase
MKIFNYIEFLKESKDSLSHYLPTYEDCVEMCSREESPFYESKFVIDGYPISIFNYRLAQYRDFTTPLESRPEVKAYEMRGLTFVFNNDGTLFKRFLLLEKFFNLNQVPESAYSIVKNYKIKFVNNKEDGSIASYIKLPNGKIVGKSKMGFDNEQANGINRIYKNRTDVKEFVDWCLNNNITAIFEYVSPANRIVLRYLEEDLILLRMRDNSTGKHLNIKDHLDKIGTMRIAPFEDDFKDLDSLIEVNAKQVDKEGVIVQAEDEYGKDFFFKLKTPWYIERHGLLTNDLYRENIIIGYILDDKIDDILGQVPEDEKEAHERINKIIAIVKKSLNEKVIEIQKAYDQFVKSGMTRKEYALKNRVGNPNFACVMNLVKGDDLKKLSEEEIIKFYDNFENYEKTLQKCEPFEMAKEWLRDQTKRLNIARDFLKKKDPSLFFQDPDPENQDS